jgi:hypothetical protein
MSRVVNVAIWRHLGMFRAFSAAIDGRLFMRRGAVTLIWSS